MTTYWRIEDSLSLYAPDPDLEKLGQARIVAVLNRPLDLPPSISPEDVLDRSDASFALLPELALITPRILATRLVGILEDHRWPKFAWCARSGDWLASLRVRNNPQGGWTVAENVMVPFGNLAFEIRAKNEIAFSKEDCSLSIGGLRLLSGNDVAGALRDTRLYLGGERRGCFGFEATLSTAHQKLLNLGLRYFQTDPDDEQQILGHWVPVFAQALVLQGWLDPLAPRDSERSVLRFTSETIDFSARTAHGWPVQLRLTSGARLRLENDPYRFDDDKGNIGDAYYLAPEGRFDIMIPQLGEGLSPGGLVVGAAATETFDRVGSICFHFGKPAFIPKPVDPADPRASAAEGRPSLEDLGGSARTPWASFEPAQGADAGYFAQPDDAPLYTWAGQPFRPKVRELKNSPPVPILPLSGPPESAGGVLKELDTQHIAPVRRVEISKARTPDPQPGLLTAKDALTPQGFQARFASSDWASLESLTLAGSGSHVLRISNPKDDAKEAFQRTRLFLVCTKAAALEELAGHVSIAGWTIDLSPLENGGPGDSPILIVKLYDGVSLVDLLRDPRAWHEPSVFCNEPASLREYLLCTKKLVKQPQPGDCRSTALAAAAESGPSDDAQNAIENLQRIARDPNWNGILALDAIVGDSPQEAKALIGGVQGKLIAHHVGVEFSRPEETNALNSSFFGLIDYTASEVNWKEDTPYQYRVKRLGVVFEASEIRRFDCRVALRLDKVFDEEAEIKDAGNIIEINGRHEKRDGKDTYSFIYDKSTRWDFAKTSLLESATLERVQLLSREDSGKIEARLSVAGSLAFRKLATDLFSLSALGFGNLQFMMPFERKQDGTTQWDEPRMDASGLVARIDATEPRQGSLLDRFPLKLSRFVFAPNENYSLSDLGLLPISLPSGNGPSQLKFGLGFEMDWGSLGGLVSGDAAFKVELVLGWKPNTQSVTAGLRFPNWGGGRLMLGLQGVLGLEVGKADLKFKDGLVGIQLAGCRLHALGQTLPRSEGLDIFVIADPGAVTKSEAALGWYAGKPFGDEYVGLGQRIGPAKPWEITSAEAALEKLKKLPTSWDDDLKGNFFRDAGWILGTELHPGKVVDVKAVFLDPKLYALHVGIPNSGLKTDITYRKLTDEAGVWSMEVTVPESLRRFEAGALTIALPSIGVSVYTDGGFLVDMGFPRGLDFTRSFQVQALPFIGWGGLYLGKLHGKASSLQCGPTDCALAIRAGFALRLGLGKEFRAGILSAGLSVTFYGILEGELGYSAGHDLAKPEAYALTGQLGVIGEIFGVVDFGLVKAGFLARLEAGVTVRLASGEDVVLWVEATVTVAVTVVIGEVCAFGKCWRIEVGFSHVRRIRFDWVLGKSPALLAPRTLVEALPAADFWPAAPQRKETIVLYLSPDVTMSSGSPAAVLLLWIDTPQQANGDSGFEKLVRAVLEIELANWFQKKPTDIKCTGADLWEQLRCARRFFSRLAPADKEARTRPAKKWKPALGSYKDIQEFLDRFFVFQVESPPDQKPCDEKPPEKKLGALFPMLPRMSYSVNGRTHQFSKDGLCAPSYEQTIDEYFSRLWAAMEQRTRGADIASDTQGPPIAQVLFAEYFSFAVRAGLDLLWEAVDAHKEDKTTKKSRAEWLRGVDYRPLAASLSRFFLHGLRLPEAVLHGQKDESTSPLYALAGQQISLSTKAATTIVVRGLVPDSPGEHVITAEKLDGVSIDSPMPPERIEPVETVKSSLSFKRDGLLNGQQLWLLPLLLRRHLVKINSGAQIELALVDLPPGAKPYPSVKAQGSRDAFKVVPATRIPVRFKPTGRAGLLALRGVALEDRLLLDQLFTTLGRQDKESSISLSIYDMAGKPVDREMVLIQTNLSTETNPQAPLQTFSAAPKPPYATNKDVANFTRLLWQATITNSGGYHLFIKKAESHTDRENGPSDEDKTEIELQFVWATGDPTGQPRLEPFHNALVSDKLGDHEYLIGTCAEIKEIAVRLEPGCIGFKLERSPTQEPTCPEPKLKDHVVHSYQLLDYRLHDASGEVKLPDALPIGPEKCKDKPIGPEECKDKTRWLYRQVLPVARFLGSEKDGRGPYAGIGKEVELQFAWRDLYGNRGDWTERKPFKFAYFDRLIPPSEWPGVELLFDLAGSAESPTLQLTLSFDPVAYCARAKPNKDPLNCPVKRDIEVCTRVQHQLGGSAVKAYVETTLEGVSAEGYPTHAHEVTVSELSGLVKSIDDLLRKYTDPDKCPSKEKLEITVTATLNPDLLLPKSNLEEFRSFLRLEREDHLDTAVGDAKKKGEREFEPIYRARSECVLPLDVMTTLSTVAERIRKPLPGFRLATGVSKDGLRPEALWLVRSSLLSLSFDSAVVYAPRPISLSLWAGDAKAHDDKDVQVQNRDVDDDARFLVDSLEELLDPAMAQKLYTARPGLLEKLADAKRRISSSFSGQLLAPVLMGGSAWQTAGDTFKEQMLRDLRTAYQIDAVVEMTLKFAGSQEGERLYGRVASAARVELSPARVIFYQKSASVTFALNVASEKPESVVEVPKRLNITHVEYDRQPQQSGFVPSRWLRLVLEETLDLGNGSIQVPIVVRRYPSAPLASSQTYDAPGLSGGTALEKLQSARHWAYVFEYETKGLRLREQDELVCEVEYGAPADATKAGLSPRAVWPNLPKALVSWRLAFEAMREVLFGEPPIENALLDKLAERLEEVTGALTNPVSLAGSDNRSYDELMITERVEKGKNRLLTWKHSKEAADSSHRVTVEPVFAKGVSCKTTTTDTTTSWRDSCDTVARRVSISGIIVCQFDQARAQFQLTRNENLKLDVPTNPMFVYRTPWVSFLDAVTPQLVRDGEEWRIDIGELVEKKTLANVFTRLFESLKHSGAAPKGRLECRYAYGDLVQPTPLRDFRSVDLAQDANTIATAVGEALKAVQRTGARLVLDLRLYDSKGKVPVLQLRNLQLKLDSVTS